MRVLVTGASGMLGRAVALAVQRCGHEVTVFQRRASGIDGREIRGDITDEAAVERAVVGQDAVIHLAALVSPVGSWEAFERVNVRATRTLADCARNAGVRRFVFVSSPSVASAGTAHVGEGALPADPDATNTFYARSKALAEQQVLAPGARDGVAAAMAVVAIRPHLVWGPGDEQLVGRILDRAGRGRLRLVGSGAALVDSTYVDNAADAIVAGLERCTELDGRALVVTNGEPRPIAELLRGICDAAGVDVPERGVPRPVAIVAGSLVERIWTRTGRSDDPPMTRFLAEQLSTAHWYDQRETRRLLRWEPAVSLDDGLAALRSHHRR